MKSDIKKKKKDSSNSPIDTKPQLNGVYEAGSSVATIRRAAREYKFSKSLSESLKRKSKNYNIPVQVVLEVFKRGVLAWDDSKKIDKTQCGFNRVNSFLAGGIARKLDEDLVKTKINIQTTKKMTREATLIKTIKGIILK